MPNTTLVAVVVRVGQDQEIDTNALFKCINLGNTEKHYSSLKLKVDFV